MAVIPPVDICKAIDAILQKRGGAYAEYSCQTIFKDDASSGALMGELGCQGANITDTYLKTQNGRPLVAIRPSQWNKKLSVIAAKDIALVTGNCEEGAAQPPRLQNVTLQEFLKDPSSLGAGYSGLRPAVCLFGSEADQNVRIRFQAVFLPVDTEGVAETGKHTSFAPEAYNWNTVCDKDRPNLMLLATSQGISLQAHGCGSKRLLLHARETDYPYHVNEYWLKVDTRFDPGEGLQWETEIKQQVSGVHEMATSQILGIKAMGTRRNALLTIQIPLLQKKERQRFPWNRTFGCENKPTDTPIPDILTEQSTTSISPTKPYPVCAGTASDSFSGNGSAHVDVREGSLCYPSKSSPRPAGVSNRGGISYGEWYGRYETLEQKNPKRNPDEHITTTVILYFTVAGGLPCEADVMAVINDLEMLYEACTEPGHQGDPAFNLGYTEFTVQDEFNITKKGTEQPPTVSNLPSPSLNKSRSPKRPVAGAFVQDVIMKRFQGLEEKGIALKSIADTKLITLGALDGLVAPNVTAIITSKFDKLSIAVQDNHTTNRQLGLLLAEIKLLCKGALSGEYST